MNSPLSPANGDCANRYTSVLMSCDSYYYSAVCDIYAVVGREGCRNGGMAEHQRVVQASEKLGISIVCQPDGGRSAIILHEMIGLIDRPIKDLIGPRQWE